MWLFTFEQDLWNGKPEMKQYKITNIDGIRFIDATLKSFACAFYSPFFLVWLTWVKRNEMATFAPCSPKIKTRNLIFFCVSLRRIFLFAWSIPSQSNLFNDNLQYFFLARNAWINRTQFRHTFWFTKNVMPTNCIQQIPHFFWAFNNLNISLWTLVLHLYYAHSLECKANGDKNERSETNVICLQFALSTNVRTE